MARIYRTTDTNLPLGETDSLWVYNALDCCLTLEVFHEIEPQLNEVTRPVYEESLACQAPVLELMLRGIAIDRQHVTSVARELEIERARVKANLQIILREGMGYELQFNKVPSPQQLQHLFYETMGLPKVMFRSKPTTNRQALEKLRGYFYSEILVNHILTLRDIGKQLSVLYTALDDDGRMRTSLNIAGTDTGRFSSYESSFGTGTNQQNVSEKLRKVFVADKGKKLAYIDYEQAEARGVGAIIWNLFRDGKYLDFCESGDLHTGVSMMTWKKLNWFREFQVMSVIEQLKNIEARKHNKTTAGALFYREDSYRQSSKKLGHASNYHGQPPEISRQTRIPVHLVSEFQTGYFGEFPGIRLWHEWVQRKLRDDRWITTFMGRQRWFFGRPWDNDTLNAAIAYEPQSAIADYLRRAMLAVWRAHIPTVDILVPVHDALLIQYDEEREAEIIPQVQRLMELEIPLAFGRSLIIPTEAQVGWNWAHQDKGNPDGLVAYSQQDKRRRSTKASFLDRKF